MKRKSLINSGRKIIILVLALLLLSALMVACNKEHEHIPVVDPGHSATCTEDGLTEGSHCSECGDVIVPQETIPAAHTPVTDKGYAPTCTEDGLTDGSHCDVCDAVLVEQKTIPATGHTSVKDNGVLPTCTEKGLTEGSHCEVCGDILVEQKTIPEEGHTPVKDNSVLPTCTENGLTEGSHCDVCGNILVKQEVIPAAHTPVVDNGYSESCYKDGLSDGSHCKVCGITLQKQEVIPAAHTFEDWVLIEEPTYTKLGREKRTCDVCDITEFRTVPMLEVNFVIILVYGDDRANLEMGSDDGSYVLQDPTRVGYEFLHWTDESGTVVPSSGTVDKNVTFYAEWQIAETTTFSQLYERALAGVDKILLAADIEITDTIYVISNTTIYAESDVTLKRASNFAGDIFVLGEYPNGRSVLFEGRRATLSIDSRNCKITIDGNRYGMEVKVVGTVFFVASSSTLNIYGNTVIHNCEKLGNERILENPHDIGTPSPAGGAVAMVVDGILNIYDGLFENNAVSTKDISDAESNGEEDYYASSYGGVIYNYSQVNIFAGEFNSNDAGRGGLIYNHNMLIIHSAVISNNSAAYGGAVYLANTMYASTVLGHEGASMGTVEFKNNSSSKNGGAICGWLGNGILIHGGVLFEANSAASGGAIYTQGAIVAKNVEFIANVALGADGLGGTGGAIYAGFDDSPKVVRDVIIDEAVFRGNVAKLGGAIAFSASGTTKGSIGYLTGVLFENNYSMAPNTDYATSAATGGYNGGAIYVTRASTLTISYCIFKNNGAIYNGGAITVVSSSSLSISDTEFEGNSSLNGGGSMFLDEATFTGQNLTFNDGQSAKGGAIYINNKTTATFTGTTFDANIANTQGGAVEIHGSKVVFNGKNIFQNNSATNYGGAIYISYNSAGLLTSNVTLNNANFTDNTVTSSGGLGGAIFAGYGCTIKIYTANFEHNVAAYGGAIAVRSSNMESSNLIFTNNEASNNGGAMFVSIVTSNDFTNESIVGIKIVEFNNNSATKNGGAVYLEKGTGATITNGSFEQNTADRGGAMYINTDSDVNLSEVSFVGNSGTSRGGAIEIHGSQLTIDGNENSFANNTTDGTGGAMYISYNEDGPLTSIVNITNVDFNGNSAGMQGGTIYATMSSTLQINKCDFTESQSGDAGGAIYLNAESKITSLQDSQFISNTATGHGGAIYVTGSTVLLISNSNFTENVSEKNGGALYFIQTTEAVSLEGGAFTSNTAKGANGGGAIYLSASAINVSGVTFTENSTTGETSDVRGGAIYFNTGSTGTITGSTFERNSSYYGGAVGANNSSTVSFVTSVFEGNTSTSHAGAIHIYGSTVPLMSECSFTENESTGNGGAIYLTSGSELTSLVNSEFTSNTAKGANGGGAIYLSNSTITIGSATFTNNKTTNTGDNIGGGAICFNTNSTGTLTATFNGNTSKYGGAIRAGNGSDVTISGSVFKGNSATNGKGGAIYLGGNSSGATCAISDSTFETNSSTSGGAIYLTESTITLTGSHFVENSSTVNGGAVYLIASSKLLSMSECEFTSNTAVGHGGAMYISASTVDVISASTFTGNTTTGNTADSNGGAIYLYKSEVTSMEGGSFDSNISNGLYGGGAIYMSGSVLNISGTTFSENEVTAKAAGARGGAIHYNSTSSGTISAEFSGNSAYEGGALAVCSKSTVSITSSKFENNSAGNYAGALYVNGSTIELLSNSTFTGNESVSNGGAIYLTGVTSFTLQGGAFVSNTANGTSGGGAIYLTGSTIAISGTSFSKNSTTNTAASVGGGAIFLNTASTGTVTGATFSENSSLHGGAVRCNNNSTGTFSGSSFTQNTAGTGQGGVIYLSSGDKGGSTAEFSDCHLTLNSAASGGAIYSTGSSVTLKDGSTVKNNSSTSGAGGIYATDSSTLSIIGCEISENTAGASGGGMYIYSTTATIRDTQFIGNTSQSNGGVAYISGSADLGGSVVDMTNVTATGNKAASGAFVYMTVAGTKVRGTQVTINSCNVTENVATKDGGGNCVWTNTTGAVLRYSEENCTFDDEVKGAGSSAVEKF